MVVYLTAGHNLTKENKGTGAFSSLNGKEYDEAKLNIEIRDKVADFIKKSSPSTTVLTDDDRTLLRDVINWLFLKKTSSDISIEFHFNASTNENANGVEVFVRDQYAVKAFTLGKEICKSLSGYWNTRGVKFANQGQHSTLPILTKPRGVNILIEVCFMTNMADMAIYELRKDKIAKEIGICIAKWC
jgi:N-acetylmuramoyl-L-alanine amidase